MMCELCDIWQVTCHLWVSVFLVFFVVFFGHVCSMLKFLGQESNLCHSSDLSHGSDNVWSSPCWATRKLWVSVVEFINWWNWIGASWRVFLDYTFRFLLDRLWHRSRSLHIQGNWIVIKRVAAGVPVVTHRKWIWLGTIRFWVLSLASLSGLRIWHCCELWFRSQMCRLAATASIRPLAWEPPYAVGVALKRPKKKKKKETAAGAWLPGSKPSSARARSVTCAFFFFFFF